MEDGAPILFPDGRRRLSTAIHNTAGDANRLINAWIDEQKQCFSEGIRVALCIAGRGRLRFVVIAAWCWELVEPYLARNLLNRGVAHPTRRQVLEEFARVWPGLTATIGVQEPFAGTIRFKWLVRLPATDMAEFLDDPDGWIGARYGGGKFKMNLHHGLHFVNTKNFKPGGDPRWAEAPALDLDA